MATENIRIVKEKIDQISSYSLIIDETIDIGTKKSLAIVIRFYDISLQSTKDHFLGLIQVTDCTAQSLFESIVNTLKTYEIPIDKLIGLGADNAAVMMGQFNGVCTKFKQVRPDIFILGCVCHSVHLCPSAAANKLPKSVEQFVRNVYNYFAYSSKRIFKRISRLCSVKKS